MRIGFDAKRAFYNLSGLGNYSRDTISSLMKNYPENEYYLYTPRKKKQIHFIGKDNENVKIVYPDGLKRIYQSYWRSISLGNRIGKDKLDIYHGLSNELPANIIQSKTKKIVTIHDLIFMRYPELYHSVDREIYQQKFFEASLAADKIIAMSQQTKDDIISFFHTDENNIEVIYQGCNPVFYELIDKDLRNKIREKYSLPKEYILSVGTLEKRKNALHVLEALSKQKIDMPLVFVGKATNYIKSLNQYIADNKMENRVFFLHNVPTADLPALYQSSKMFIYPSIFEGFGIPILEALNSGTPVITNKYGCFVEAGGDAAIYINPNNPEEIGEAVKSLLDNPEKAKKLVEKGFEHAKQFKQDIIAEKIMCLYKSII